MQVLAVDEGDLQSASGRVRRAPLLWSGRGRRSGHLDVSLPYPSREILDVSLPYPSRETPLCRIPRGEQGKGVLGKGARPVGRPGRLQCGKRHHLFGLGSSGGSFWSKYGPLCPTQSENPHEWCFSPPGATCGGDLCFARGARVKCVRMWTTRVCRLPLRTDWTNHESALGIG